MRYEVIHRTTYTYTSDVSVSHHIARLAPRQCPSQQCLQHELLIQPAPALTNSRQDYFGNYTAFFTVEGAHRSLSVTALSRVEVLRGAPPDVLQTLSWENVRDRCGAGDPSAGLEAGEFAFASPLIPRLPDFANYAAASFAPQRPILKAVLDLTRRIHGDFKFDARATTVATPMAQVIRNKRGVCQDFAHFQIGCLRAVGLPARYVSGYLETQPPPGKPKLIGADASHAWVQVFVPPAGWIDVDPTNNLLPSDRHIIVACGRDFDDVSPIRGVIVGGGRHQLTVGVDVVRLEESTGDGSLQAKPMEA